MMMRDMMIWATMEMMMDPSTEQQQQQQRQLWWCQQPRTSLRQVVAAAVMAPAGSVYGMLHPGHIGCASPVCVSVVCMIWVMMEMMRGQSTEQW
jgi:hypothetical protein